MNMHHTDSKTHTTHHKHTHNMLCTIHIHIHHAHTSVREERVWGPEERNTIHHNITWQQHIKYSGQHKTSQHNTTHHSIKRHQHSKNITAAQIKVPHHITSHHMHHNKTQYSIILCARDRLGLWRVLVLVFELWREC